MDEKEKRAAYMRSWRNARRERAREISRIASAKYSARFPERRAASSRRYVAKLKADDPDGYREKLNSRHRRWYRRKVATDPEYGKKRLEQNAAWRARHPEQARASMRAAMAKWRKTHPEKELAARIRHRPAKNAAMVRLRRKRRTALLAFFGGCCRLCGYDSPRALQLDHIHGDGAADRRAGNGKLREQYLLMMSNPEAARKKYQLLCFNCNFAKGA